MRCGWGEPGPKVKREGKAKARPKAGSDWEGEDEEAEVEYLGTTRAARSEQALVEAVMKGFAALTREMSATRGMLDERLARLEDAYRGRKKSEEVPSAVKVPKAYVGKKRKRAESGVAGGSGLTTAEKEVVAKKGRTDESAEGSQSGTTEEASTEGDGSEVVAGSDGLAAGMAEMEVGDGKEKEETSAEEGAGESQTLP